MGTTDRTALSDLRDRLDGLTHRDAQRLGRRLEGVRGQRDQAGRARKMAGLTEQVVAAERHVAARRAAVPVVHYPPELPISERRDDIAAAIRDHQVVVVAGETGSGKTTQLPKICLELGRGVRGMVGHTQPRRIAARAVAERVAEELGTELGTTVGYTVRFTDQMREDTLVRVMTDGILLAEIQRDRMLSRYDTLIIDEAHERSLNIDFLLGYLKQLLPRRPELKVVITSATIDTARFSEHFDDAPVIEVSGRTYPVEVRYRPVVDPDDSDAQDRDQVTAVVEAVDELTREGPGDVLVFLSGEREIRDTAEVLRPLTHDVRRPLEVVPLYARLSSAEQHKVFAAHTGRRVVLATNVAETSLTVPGIRYVVDAGTARISRYSQRTKVQRLPIEPVSRASANQRAGRCGRVEAGICVRLYTQEDFESRPEFTDPEILRTHLASVILQMASLGLGEVSAFPFVDPPDHRAIRDGVALLHELGAFDPEQEDPRKRLTPLGRKLSQLPLDPRLARMVVEADRNGCVAEVLVIAAALSIQDPRERPVDHQQKAAELHARFSGDGSDFITYLNLWQYLREQQHELSSSAFRRLCRSEFLHYLRIREWQDLHAQLRQVVKGMDIDLSSAPEAHELIHVSLLAGLLSHVGLKDDRRSEFLGARGARFAISPGSTLARKPPGWVMAGELVETSRMWARTVARIEPEWAEKLAPHLVKRSYSEPHWSSKQSAAMAFEKVLLYGIPLVAARKVGYGRVDPELSRELFIRHALVEGDWRTHHPFFHANLSLLEDVAELEHRARRRDIIVDDDTLFAFYDNRIPDDVVSGRHFDSWWKKTRRDTPDLLTFTRDLLIADGAAVSDDDFPVVWQHAGTSLRMTYQFEPGTAQDGVTVHVPIAVLGQVDSAGFDWQVPGLRNDLATALIRSLPKHLRTSFVPAPDNARSALTRIDPYDGPLTGALGDELTRMTGTPVPRDAWDLDRVPAHLRMTFRVIDDAGTTLAEGKDLEPIRSALAGHMRTAVSAAMSDLERESLQGWSIGELPKLVEQSGGAVRGYPSLVHESGSVSVRVLADESEQRASMAAGTRALLLESVGSPMRSVVGRLSNTDKLALAHNPHGGVPALLEDCLACAVDAVVARHGGPAWDGAGFEALEAAVRAELEREAADVVNVVARILTSAHEIERRVSESARLAMLPALADIKDQLKSLVFKDFAAQTSAARLPDVLRYLRAASHRLDRLGENPTRDRDLMGDVQRLAGEYAGVVAGLPAARRTDADVVAVHWMLHELRVSLFAQTLKAAYPVSDKRIRKALASLQD